MLMKPSEKQSKPSLSYLPIDPVLPVYRDKHMPFSLPCAFPRQGLKEKFDRSGIYKAAEETLDQWRGESRGYH